MMLLGALVTACGDDTSGAGGESGTGGADASTGTTSSSTGAGGDANGAPSLEGATELVLDGPIPEGGSVATELSWVDAEGDAFTTELRPAAFVDGALDGDALTLRVGYRAEGDLPSSGESEVLGTIVARDARGAEANVSIRGEVAPLRWSDATTWTGASGPAAREHGTLLADDASGSIYLMFGSGYSPYLEPLEDAWRFDVATRTWSAVTMDGDVPPGGGSKRLGGVRGSGEGWIYAGYGENNAMLDGVYHVVADGDALHFEELEQVNPPGGRALHTFAYDPGTETFAMFGGASTALHGDTWTMKIDGGVATWAEIIPAEAEGVPHPSPRFGAFSGMDEELGRLVLFSGQVSFANLFGQDTWVLDMRAEGGPRWVEVTSPGGPPGRRNGTSAWDPSARRLFVFGGTSDGATTQPGLFAFDARPGHEGWSLVEREGEPALRSSGFGVFAVDAVWVGFGNSASAVYADLTRLGH